MGTVLLLAAVVLAASATPIEKFLYSSLEESHGLHEKDAHAPDIDADSATLNQYGEDSNDEQSEDTSSSTVDQEGNHDEGNDNNNESAASSGDANTSNPEGGDSTSLNHSVSATSTEDGEDSNDEQPQDTSSSTADEGENHHEGNDNNNESSASSDDTNGSSAEGGDSTSFNHSISATSTEAATEVNTANKSKESSPPNDRLPVSPEDNTVNNSGESTPTSSISTASVTSIKPETSTQQSNESVSTPGDADPTDCKNATQKNHTYVMCTFSCQGDELFTAPDNSSCYLYPPNVTNDIIIAEEYNHAQHKVMGIGVCFGGNCVRNLSTVPEATTESSPADDSTQQRTESYTTPSDDDPTDCKNASKTNHTYVMCTFSCQGDEVFTAPDNSSCYLYPPNVTYEILIAEEYNHTQHTVMGTGFCFQGNCVRNLSMVSVAPTESSPGTTATATTSTTTATTTTVSAAETGGERESATVQTSDDPERSPQPSPPEDTPSETPNSSPEKPLPKVASAEKEGASSTTTKGPLGLPGALP